MKVTARALKMYQMPMSYGDNGTRVYTATVVLEKHEIEALRVGILVDTPDARPSAGIPFLMRTMIEDQLKEDIDTVLSVSGKAKARGAQRRHGGRRRRS